MLLFTTNFLRCSYDLLLYKLTSLYQLLHEQIQKVQKDYQDISFFLRFCDLRAQKLLVKHLWNLDLKVALESLWRNASEAESRFWKAFENIWIHFS